MSSCRGRLPLLVSSATFRLPTHHSGEDQISFFGTMLFAATKCEYESSASSMKLYDVTSSETTASTANSTTYLRRCASWVRVLAEMGNARLSFVKERTMENRLPPAIRTAAEK